MLKSALICLIVAHLAIAIPEIGHWEFVVGLDDMFYLSKSVYEKTNISLKVHCSHDVSLKVIASAYLSECANAFTDGQETPSHTAEPTVTKILENKEIPLKCGAKEAEAIALTTGRAGAVSLSFSLVCDDNQKCADISINAVADMKSNYGYLSAIEYPLRTFYGLLAIGYVILGLLWLVFTCRHWSDLLRIQYYITLVILIGIIEQITLFAVYESLNRTGTIVKSALVFSLFTSSLKRTLARFLVMVACVGYGITKSRLGVAYRRIIWICVAYLIFALLDGGLRVFHMRFKTSLKIILASLPIVLIDCIILSWSCSYLVTTLRETRMKRNTVKYRLYRIFSGLLITVSFISILCMATSVFVLHRRACTNAWQYIWWDESLWPLLFFVVLSTIVILWRPSSTNRVYARSAFLDTDEDVPPEDLEELLMDAIVSGVNDSTGTPRKSHNQYASEEDALRWAEENIPPSETRSGASGNQDSQPTGGNANAANSNSGSNLMRPQLKID